MEQKKTYRIKKVQVTEKEVACVDSVETVCRYFDAIKKIVGVALIILAATLINVLSVMPIWAAFLTVFAYISLQIWIWYKAPNKEK